MLGRACRQGLAPVPDRGDARTVPGVVPQDGVRRSRRRPWERRRARGVHPGGVETQAGEDLAGEAAPRRLPRAGGVVGAVRGAAADQGLEDAGQVQRPRGLAVLVVHHVEGLPLRREAGHGGHEAGPAGAVQPRGAHHPAARAQGGHGPLAGGLGASVGRPRRELGGLGVRRRGVPGEDVVGGDLHQLGADLGARPGQVRGAGGVDRERLRLARLGVVHSGPRGGVDDDVLAAHGRPAGLEVGDIQRRAGSRRDLVPGAGEDGGEVLPEHAGRAGDQPAAHREVAGRSGTARGCGRRSHGRRLTDLP